MPKKKFGKNQLVASDPDSPFETQIQEIITKVGDSKYDWLLISQQLIFPCEGCFHADRESLISDIAGALACGYFIAAIFYQGRRLSEDEIKPMREEALDGLGPISKARAKGIL